MKTVLAIAACGPRLEVALASPAGTAPGLVALAGPTPRSDLVVAAVDLLLRAAGVGRAELEGVVATRGPGSFTGVRVALATAQGLAMALGIPGHGFSSLLAQAARTDTPECLAMQPARRGFAYAQAFARHGAVPEPLEEPRIVALADLEPTPRPVVAPEGMRLSRGVAVAAARVSTAEALFELLARQERPDASTLSPLYLEPPPARMPAPPTPLWPPSPKAS